ncbi:MAG: ABC transporter substrate-binding protein, partial [Christensenellales bacterium]|nr:ABC transporter substrate-binding protein [Christensenellales bacterium]
APYQYSFGQGTFLNEMIELIGATNIFADQDGWIPVSAEQVVAANPDVIITNADYMEGAVAEIEAREGWAEVAAVKNHEVYLIGANVTSQPCQNIVDALMEIAADVYPEVYGELIAK